MDKNNLNLKDVIAMGFQFAGVRSVIRAGRRYFIWLPAKFNPLWANVKKVMVLVKPVE